MATTVDATSAVKNGHDTAAPQQELDSPSPTHGDQMEQHTMTVASTVLLSSLSASTAPASFLLKVLSDELLLKVLLFLSPVDLLACTQVCRRLARVALDISLRHKFSWRLFSHRLAQGETDLSTALSAELRGHGASIRALAFYQQTFLLSASTDGTVRVWDTSSAVIRGGLARPRQQRRQQQQQQQQQQPRTPETRDPAVATSLRDVDNTHFLPHPCVVRLPVPQASERDRFGVSAMLVQGDMLLTGSMDGHLRRWHMPTLLRGGYGAHTLDTAALPEEDARSVVASSRIPDCVPDDDTLPPHGGTVTALCSCCCCDTATPGAATAAAAKFESEKNCCYGDDSSGVFRVFSGSSDATICEWTFAPAESVPATSRGGGGDPSTPANLLARTIKGHTAGITDLAVLSDGKYLASTAMDKTVRIWDIQNHHYNNVASGSDGGGGDGDRPCLCVLLGHPLIVNCTIALPGGALLTGGVGASIRFWDAGGAAAAAQRCFKPRHLDCAEKSTNKEEEERKEQKGEENGPAIATVAAAAAAAPATVAAITATKLRVTAATAATAATKATARATGAVLSSTTQTPLTGQISALAVAAALAVQAQEAASAAALAPVPAVEKKTQGKAQQRMSRPVPESGRTPPLTVPCVAVLYGHKRPVLALEYAREDDLVFSGGHDNMLAIWNAPPKLPGAAAAADAAASTTTATNTNTAPVIIPEEPIASFRAHNGSVSSLVTGSNGRLYTGSWDKVIRLWLPPVPSSAEEVVTALRGMAQHASLLVGQEQQPGQQDGMATTTTTSGMAGLVLGPSV